jgi:bifunctional non-homologous end joining protein LigD
VSLAKYYEKRDFKNTSEPAGNVKAKSAGKRKLTFVIQKHRATQLHYDFRLEFGGVLLSWAVPKGPSLDPSVKRLAMQVEDHPIDYASFEGVIPEGQYGGGTVMVWDRGTWIAESEDTETALKKGDLKFTLEGEKLHGSWVLVRTRGFGSTGGKSWLLIKHRDRFASNIDITAQEPRSATSNRLLAEIASEEGGDVAKASSGDPPTKTGRKPKGRRATGRRGGSR